MTGDAEGCSDVRCHRSQLAAQLTPRGTSNVIAPSQPIRSEERHYKMRALAAAFGGLIFDVDTRADYGKSKLREHQRAGAVRSMSEVMERRLLLFNFL